MRQIHTQSSTIVLTLVKSLKSGLEESMSSEADFLCPFFIGGLACFAELAAGTDALSTTLFDGGSGAGLRGFRF